MEGLIMFVVSDGKARLSSIEGVLTQANVFDIIGILTQLTKQAMEGQNDRSKEEASEKEVQAL